MNHSEDPSKRVRIFGNVIAAALVILSLFYILTVGIPVLKHSIREGVELFETIFLFISIILFSIFIGYCLVVARRSYKGLTKESLRSVCFIASLIVYAILISITRSILKIEHSTPKWDIWFGLSQILCMIPAGLFYWLTNKYLTQWLGFDTSIDWERRKKAARKFFGLMAFFVWGFLMLFARNLEEAHDIDTPLWIFVGLLLPVILAFGFYRLSTRIAIRGCPRDLGAGFKVQPEPKAF